MDPEAKNVNASETENTNVESVCDEEKTQNVQSPKKENNLVISLSGQKLVFILSLVSVVAQILGYMFIYIYASSKALDITRYVFLWISGLSLLGAIVFYCMGLSKTKKMEFNPSSIALLIAILAMLI